MRVLLMIGMLAGGAAGVEPASMATGDKYNVTPEEHAACDADAEKLCLAAYPDEDKLISCMRKNRSDLTPLCLASLKAGLSRRHMPPL